MNKIAELISRLCPDRVEFKTLDSLISYVQPGPYIVSSTEYDAHYSTPVLTAGQSFILGYTNEEEGIYNASSQKPVIIFDDFTTSFHWVDFDFKVKSSALKILKIKDKQEADFRYIYMAMKTIHFIPTNHMRHWISLYSKFEIPFPPLNIQKEIVSILDSFTSLIDKMKQEAEMRKKQMGYYREKLFSFGKEECEWRTLNELFTFKNGINKEKNDFGRGTPIINYVDVYRKRGLVKEDIKGLVNSNTSEQSRYKCKKGDVFFTRTSETKEEVGFPAVLLEDIENCVFSGFVLKATPTTDLLDTHYCKYCFFTYQFRKEVIKSATYTTRALTNGTSLSKISIPVPSLEKQHQIAFILDTFETYISKLEKMIVLRQKQYEYYREKLLTFE